MRRAYSEVGFIQDGQTLQGFSLGFDFCAEHEYGMPSIMEELGIALPTYPFGIQDRTMTVVPERLVFKHYDWKPKDRRFKKTVPAALLFMYPSLYWHDLDNEDAPSLVHRFDTELYIGPDSKRNYDPQRHDIACSWSGRSGFCIHVRGAENVALLEQLHAAFLRKDIALGLGRMVGFSRSAPALVIASKVSAEARASVEETDRAYRVLHEAVEATGIKQELQAAKCGFYGFSPQWMDGEGSDIAVYLNPTNQSHNASGWFTIDELRQWAKGKGPVVDSLAISESLKKRHTDFEIHLIKALQAKGLGLRFGVVYQYLDEDRTIPGVRMLTTKDSQTELPSGVYPLSQIEAMVNAFLASQTAATA